MNERPGPRIRRETHDHMGRRGGLACPECGEMIEISLDDLLVRRTFGCRKPGCGLVLRLDQRGSEEAVETLRKLKTKLREIGA